MSELSGTGWAIGSGGAEGIDGVAHRAAIDAGLATIVVTVGGLDGRPHPAKHESLFRDVIASGGALLSLDPDGTTRAKPDFFPRNQVLAAISTAVIAVELRPKRGFGGTGNMARAARDLGRPVMAVAHAPWTRGGPGFAGVMCECRATPVASVQDVQRVLASALSSVPAAEPRAPEPSALPPAEAVVVDADQRAVLAVLSQRMHLDAICAKSGISVTRAARALFGCCLEGMVVEGPTGMYARVERK